MYDEQSGGGSSDKSRPLSDKLPLCSINLGDASRQAQLLPVSDLTEIVAEAI